jgi:hypothetical protein
MQKRQFICDRCGRVVDSLPNGKFREMIREVIFFERVDCGRNIKSGDVCEGCYNDFVDLASNFFDEVNRVE